MYGQTCNKLTALRGFGQEKTKPPIRAFHLGILLHSSIRSMTTFKNGDDRPFADPVGWLNSGRYWRLYLHGSGQCCVVFNCGNIASFTSVSGNIQMAVFNVLRTKNCTWPYISYTALDHTPFVLDNTDTAG